MDTACEARASAKQAWKSALPALRALLLPKKWQSFQAWLWATATLTSRTMFAPFDPDVGALALLFVFDKCWTYLLSNGWAHHAIPAPLLYVMQSYMSCTVFNTCIHLCRYSALKQVRLCRRSDAFWRSSQLPALPVPGHSGDSRAEVLIWCRRGQRHRLQRRRRRVLR